MASARATLQKTNNPPSSGSVSNAKTLDACTGDSAPAPSNNSASHISAPSVFLLGDTGSGKTTSLATLLEAGIETFVIVTEPNGLDSLIDAAARSGNLSKLHYKVIAPTRMSIADLMKKSAIVNQKDAGAIQQMSMGLDKNKYQQYATLLQNIGNFHDDATGQHFGDVTEWGPDRAFAIDSLTGLNYMAIQYTAGNRPTMTMPEFGLAQTLIRDLINLLTSLNCWFVLTAHMENQADELTGQRKHFPLTVGKALSPELPRFFSEVVLVKREGEKYYWSTNDDRAVVKHRALPASSTLQPSFVQLKRSYDERQRKLTQN